MEIMKQNIEELNLKENVLNILYKNKINTIEKLCDQSKTDLKMMNIEHNDIYKIEVELQLEGLNLRNNNY